MKQLVTEELLERVNNRFLISVAASKRARQLKDGAVPLVDGTEGATDLVIALDEIMEGKINIDIEKEEVIAAAAEAAVAKKKVEAKKTTLKKEAPKKKSKSKPKAKK